ncbi:MAG: hypothetical protein WBK91_01960 [Alphaproteobacteria bacterium]
MAVKDRLLAFTAAALCLTLPHCTKISLGTMPGTFLLDERPHAYVFSEEQTKNLIQSGATPMAACVKSVDKPVMLTNIVPVGSELDAQRKNFPDSKILAILPPKNVIILRYKDGSAPEDIVGELLEIMTPQNGATLRSCLREYVDIMKKGPLHLAPDRMPRQYEPQFPGMPPQIEANGANKHTLG